MSCSFLGAAFRGGCRERDRDRALDDTDAPEPRAGDLDRAREADLDRARDGAGDLDRVRWREREDADDRDSAPGDGGTFPPLDAEAAQLDAEAFVLLLGLLSRRRWPLPAEWKEEPCLLSFRLISALGAILVCCIDWWK